MTGSSTRRRLLRTIGAAAALGGSSMVVEAHSDHADPDDRRGGEGGLGERERLFVHPAECEEPAKRAVRECGGEVRVEYDNFEFVAARVPLARRSELVHDARIGRLDPDHVVTVPEPLSEALTTATTDCTTHPSEELPWGWRRVWDRDTTDVAYTGSGVDVGVLDTGVQRTHCDLRGGFGRGTNCTDSPTATDRRGHGTHVAGTVGARDNDVGVVGVAPGARLRNVKVLGDDGSGRSSWIVSGIDWCISNDVEVISMSFGASAISDAYLAALRRAHRAGHLLVAAAGNSGNRGACPGDDNLDWPARSPRVVAVSALAGSDADPDQDRIASYSSVGDQYDTSTATRSPPQGTVELLAPGSSVLSTYAENGYATLSGTSMATPHVSGVAAAAWSKLDSTSGATGPDRARRDRVRRAMQRRASPLLGSSCLEGYGLARADRVLGAV